MTHIFNVPRNTHFFPLQIMLFSPFISVENFYGPRLMHQLKKDLSTAQVLPDPLCYLETYV